MEIGGVLLGLLLVTVSGYLLLRLRKKDSMEAQIAEPVSASETYFDLASVNYSFGMKEEAADILAQIQREYPDSLEAEKIRDALSSVKNVSEEIESYVEADFISVLPLLFRNIRYSDDSHHAASTIMNHM